MPALAAWDGGPWSFLRDRARQGLVRSVRRVFNDEARGQRPVERSNDALFPPNSVIWRVHGDVTSMMIGGIAALLLQMLHPLVLAGVWDHSNFRTDMLGRLRRTSRFIALTTYGPRADAEQAIARVRSVHDRISGVLPDGTPYRATDPHLLAWVHVTEAWSFSQAWQRYGNRPLTAAEFDRYFAEIAIIGEALGATPVPKTHHAAGELIEAMRPELAADARTREVAQLVLNHPAASPLVAPVQHLTMQAAVDLLPDWARRMHGLARTPAPARPLVTTGALGLAKTLRWAFSG
ncbi:oxygenase MpaB family protein [Sphingomonas sp. ID0503]|uniref:oxygenase MpaB family protein n=1 Tax=Sphingomonas sp. ID0503 TaxID=3399691 RepID=UPI003AFAE3A7